MRDESRERKVVDETQSHTPEELAEEMIAVIKHELALGTKHYSKEGELLLSVFDILTELQNDGGITIAPAEARRYLFEAM